MALKTTSVTLDVETLSRIGQMADAIDKPRAWLMAQAIKQYVERESGFIQDVQKGIEDADAGCLSNHDDVKSKWEPRRANKMVYSL